MWSFTFARMSDVTELEKYIIELKNGECQKMTPEHFVFDGSYNGKSVGDLKSLGPGWE